MFFTHTTQVAITVALLSFIVGFTLINVYGSPWRSINNNKADDVGVGFIVAFLISALVAALSIIWGF